MDVIHNSRLRQYRNPQGAAAVHTELSLSALTPYKGLHIALMLRKPKSARFNRLEMHRHQKDGVFEWNIRIQLETPGLYHYYFVAADGGERFHVGPEVNATGGMGQSYHNSCPYYQITCFEPWGKSSLRSKIMYHIFPDRFYKPDGHNDYGYAYHRRMGRRIYVHEKWEQMPLYKPFKGEPFYDPCDYFGGNLQGIMEKLPYIASLGVEVIYLNPIMESPSNHKYNVSDYKKVDPAFGDEETLRELCKKARNLGIEIMIDGVFSHTGSDSIYFNKTGAYDSLGAYQSMDSPYYSWYTFYQFPDSYKSWWGFKTLPEVNEESVDFKHYIMRGKDSVVAKWNDMGVHLWRLDVADELPGSFIRALNASLKAMNPKAALLGEVWEDASNKFSHNEQRSYCMGQELESVMNYPLRNIAIDFFTNKQNAEFVRKGVLALFENYPREFFYSCMNLTSSHDVVRLLSVLCGAPPRDALPREEQAKVLFKGEILRQGKRLMKLFALLLYMLPGSPCIYYGDEAGMQGMADPFNRGTYPWGSEDTDLISFFKKLGNFRKNHILKDGKFIIAALKEDVLAVVRYVRNGKDAFSNTAKSGFVAAVINRGRETKYALDLNACYEGADGDGLHKARFVNCHDYRSGENIDAGGGLLTGDIDKCCFRILVGDII